MARKLSRGDVHLCRFAPLGKQRPVERSLGHLETVTIAPISSTMRCVPSEVVLAHRTASDREWRGSA